MAVTLVVDPARVLRRPRHPSMHRPAAIRAGNQRDVGTPAAERTAARAGGGHGDDSTTAQQIYVGAVRGGLRAAATVAQS